MGCNILEQVLQQLRDADFTADVAYPGQKYPPIRKTVAAVHIRQVDRENRTVTVEVSILCPAQLGGTVCETAALRATEVLGRAGAACVQNGCDYDGMAQAYCVSILATFPGTANGEDCWLGPGFSVQIDGTLLPYVFSFTAEKSVEQVSEYEIGTCEPVCLDTGRVSWNITLEEHIPVGAEEEQSGNDFELLVEKANGIWEAYTGCRWNSIKRQLTASGIHRIRKGIAVNGEGI